MSERRLVRLYIGGEITPQQAELLLAKIERCNTDRPGSLLDGHWYPAPRTMKELLTYITKERWLELKEEEAIQGTEVGVFGLEVWLREEQIPYDQHMPPFGDLPGVLTYYRPPALTYYRNCDFCGNEIVEAEDMRDVLELIKKRKYKLARERIEDYLGPDVARLPHLKVRR